MERFKKELEETYKNLCKAFDVHSSGWSMIHEHYSPSMFCRENRLTIVGEYLVWKDFTEDAKRYGVIYYQGIDTFLEEYKHAVESRVNLE